jgi:hypothetical protein
MKTTLTVEIEYDPQKTDPEGLACAMDRLLETALSIPEVMDEYGSPTIGEFFVAKGTETESALKAAGLHLTEPADSDRMAGRKITLPCYGITLTLVRENGVEEPGSGSIASDLREPEAAANRRYNAAVDGLESLILAHACAGVDVESPAYIEGIETAVDAIANRATP